MYRIVLLPAIFFFVSLSGQNSEIEEMRRIDKKYDSMLIAYQKSAKDSLAKISRKERLRIMALHENEVNMNRRKLKFGLLEKIKQRETSEEDTTFKEIGTKCNNNGDSMKFPTLANKSLYKPTGSPDVPSESGLQQELKSTVIFVVNSSGKIKNVRASGDHQDFNRELEITMYKIEKWTPLCVNGVTTTNRFRLPVTMNFK
ncbi:energy transducer TonB [Chryseobacterium sp. R2A-55]|uniref:energy transducer TonB n=1 Tax=Chryseobacterium sp. R2A-55 TaxID=2744445 RepID=UPI001F301F67|nr:energy transducer TonB [Chryseobacterium sp. R2A-55]